MKYYQEETSLHLQQKEEMPSFSTHYTINRIAGSLKFEFL